MRDFTLPSLGADMDHGKLIEWLVKPGDRVSRGQVVAVVDTAKAAIDVEIWFDGEVSELVTRPGETIPVGAVMARIEAVGAGAAGVPTPPPRPATVPAAPSPQAPAPRRHRISPAARKHAEGLGLDPQTIAGTGPQGLVTLADVDAAAAARVAPAQETPATAPQPRTGPDRHAEMRAAIAAAMSRSKREIPHYYLAETIPMKAALTWLTSANQGRPITERVLLAVLQLKAVALALADYPEMNGYFRDGAFEPVRAAHIGVAISLRQGGLIAPAIHDVADKSLTDLMRDLTDLALRARAGTLRSSEVTDPTITVTNLGDQGVDSVFGVIYPPQVALVGFGRVVERPWAVDGLLGVMPAVTASLAADHRVSDGHRGALFLADVRDRLQHPEAL